MKKNIYYNIKLTNFDKHQQKLKRSHKAILLSVNFLSDPKIQMLNPATKLLFLSCLLVAGESTSSQIKVSHVSLCFQSGVKSGSLQSQLDLLQSLQLLSYDKTEVLINRKEKKGKEKKGKEINTKEHNKIETEKNVEFKQQTFIEKAAPHLDDEPVGKFLVGVYCNLWKERYKSSPPLRPQDTKQLKTIGEGNGKEKTKKLFEAYFKMPDPYFVKRRHDLQTFLNNLASIAAFCESNRVVTNSELRTMDSMVTNANTAQALREGKI